jgi:spermidine/putrescine transport system permease protein
LKEKTGRAPWPLLVPAGWLFFFTLGPLLLIVALSFLQRGVDGEVVVQATWENYRRLAGLGLFGFDPFYPQLLGRTLLVATAVTLACLTVGLPYAFLLSRLKRGWKEFLLVATILPLWINLLVRTYAWQILLQPHGWWGKLVAHFNAGAVEALTYPGHFAVAIAMLFDYLPFFVLPVHVAVEKINWSIPEAAADLGANAVGVFRHGILPQISTGILTGALFVFLPCIGQFIIPDLLGGAKVLLMGSALQQQFGQSRDWPFGAAIATVTLLLLLLAYLLVRKLQQRGKHGS